MKGTIAAHVRLPSVRQLAQHLGVSRNPVETAYSHLVAEGFVVNRVKSGYFAAELQRLELTGGARRQRSGRGSDAPAAQPAGCAAAACTAAAGSANAGEDSALTGADGIEREKSAVRLNPSGSARPQGRSSGAPVPAWLERGTAAGPKPQSCAEGAVCRGGAAAQDGECRSPATSRAVASGQQNLPASQPDLIAFDYDQMDTEHFPLALWRKMTLQSLQPCSRELLQYGDPKGEPLLRELIAGHLRQHRAVLCDPEQIVITSGTQQSAVLLGMLLRESHRQLAAEASMHPGLRELFKLQGLTVMPVPLESDGIAVDTLLPDAAASGRGGSESRRLSAVRAVYVTPSHQFPHGMILSAAKRVKLLQWAEACGGLIIEDDYDSDFLYEGRPVPALQGMDSAGCVVYMGTFSKALAPAVRLSYLILPPPLLERFERSFSFYDQTASRLTQRTMELFMQRGHFARHIRRMRKVYRLKREALAAAVRRHFGALAELSGTASGLHAIVRVNADAPPELLVRQALAYGVKLTAVSHYEAGASGGQYDFGVAPDVVDRPPSCSETPRAGSCARCEKSGDAEHAAACAAPASPDDLLAAGSLQAADRDAAARRAQPQTQFVLGFGGLPPERIEEGIRRLSAAFCPYWPQR